MAPLSAPNSETTCRRVRLRISSRSKDWVATTAIAFSALSSRLRRRISSSASRFLVKARGKPRWGSGQHQRSILSSHRHFKVANVVLLFDIFMESVTLASVNANVLVKIQGKQVFAALVAKH